LGAGFFLAKGQPDRDRQTDGQTDRQMDRKVDERTEQTKVIKLILVFHNFAKTPKNNRIEENIVKNRMYARFSLIITRIV
jgi:3-dehydroquinate dehydratase